MLDDGQVGVGFLLARRPKRHRFEDIVHRSGQTLVGDTFVLHEVVDGRQWTQDLCAVNDAGRQASKIPLHLVLDRLGIVGDLIRLGDAQWAIGHVANDILSDAHDLCRFGAVDRVEVGIVFQPVVSRRRQHGGHALDGCGIGHCPTLPLDDAIRAKVELQFTAVVRGNDIPMRSKARLAGIEDRLAVDQFIEARDVFLWCHAPESCWRCCRCELDAIGQRAEQQVVIDEVALVRIEVGTEPALVSHDTCQFADDPVRELQPMHDRWLLGILGRHLFQGDLGPDSSPGPGVAFIHRPQVKEREIAGGFFRAMTVQAMAGKKRSSEAAKVVAGLLAGRVSLATCRGLQAGGEHDDQSPSGRVHASTSLSGPVLLSNCFASLADMLKRSQFCPAACRSVA